jgi:hypothetical protein
MGAGAPKAHGNAARVHLLCDAENSPVQRQLSCLSLSLNGALKYEGHSLSHNRIDSVERWRVAAEGENERISAVDACRHTACQE